ESTFESQLKKKNQHLKQPVGHLLEPRRPCRRHPQLQILLMISLQSLEVLRDLENSRTLRGKLKKDEERDWITTNVHRSARSVEINFSLFVCVYDYLYLSSYKFFYGVSVLKQKHWQKRMSVTVKLRELRQRVLQINTVTVCSCCYEFIYKNASAVDINTSIQLVFLDA
ncbi:hypothetical protein IFM89_032822, partial [Coptis chinensis]